jgi:hypothetical protein
MVNRESCTCQSGEWEIQVQILSLTTSALDAEASSALRTGRFIPTKQEGGCAAQLFQQYSHLTGTNKTH